MLCLLFVLVWPLHGQLLLRAVTALERAVAEPVTTSAISEEHVGSAVRVEVAPELNAPPMSSGREAELLEDDEPDSEDRRPMRMR